jgi:predicted kinase
MATTVKTLVNLANELHAAYTAITEFDLETEELKVSRPATFNRREREYQRSVLDKAVDKTTDRLASAIDKATPERLKEAEKAMGDNVYVFDGF